MDNLSLTQQLNYKNIEISQKLYKKSTQNIIRSLINNVPREDLIEALIKKKIIKRDWEQKNNKYILKNDNLNKKEDK